HTSSAPAPGKTTRPPTASSSASQLPYVVERAAGAVVGDNGYVLGGLVPGDRSIRSILSVDLSTGAAKRVALLPSAAHDAAAAAIVGSVFLFGGSGASGTLVQRFDPVSRSVTTIGSLPRTLSDLSAV